VGCEKQRLCSPWPSRKQGTSLSHPGQACAVSGAAPKGLAGHRAFFLGTRIEEAPHAPRVVGAGAAPPPNPPPRPASGSHRLPNALGQVGEQYGPSIAPFAFARARCPFCHFQGHIPQPPGGAARGSHTGQFLCFGPRSYFIAPALGISNGFWPLNRAVGRAYIRKTVPTDGVLPCIGSVQCCRSYVCKFSRLCKFLYSGFCR
jgi:hypothetical protein